MGFASVRFCTVAQDLAQLEWAFGNETASLVANHRARVFLDPSFDPQSRAHLAALGLAASGAVLLGPRAHVASRSDDELRLARPVPIART